MRKTSLIVMVPLVAALSGCATDPFPQATDMQKGAVIGALGGAALGAVVDKNHRGRGALIGAVGGGVAGGLVGHYMDRQKQDLEKALSAERQSGAIDIDKLANNTLKVTMTGRTAFASDSTEIQPGFYSTMDKMASVMNKYGKTTLTIVGHTDNVGSPQHNRSLSERRAHAVERAFHQRGVTPERLSAYGRGEEEPRATNATEAGRQQNRRVEILVEPVVAEG
jgi:outer membrane protein OmpA-like peptidoglycan-associated protein